MENENVRRQQINQNIALTPETPPKPDLKLWLKTLSDFSLFTPRNTDQARQSILEAHQGNAPLPFILTFCPAIENLQVPTTTGQTRQIIPLDNRLPRARAAIEELIAFMLFTKLKLNISPEIFLVFADSLEKGAENMFTNVPDMPKIADASIKGVQDLFFLFDQNHPGLLQRNRIVIPKIRKQSNLNFEANKQGRSRNALIERREAEMFDPISPLFRVWEKHLILTRKDDSFVATGWQSRKGSEALWTRVRFLLAEFMTDGEILPQLAKTLNPKKFSEVFPKPIFITSTTREAGFEMEVDGFNTTSPVSVLAPFHNIGRWTEAAENSPWPNFLNEAIIK